MSSRPELRDLLQAEAARQQADTIPAFTGLQRRATRRRQRRVGGSLAAVLAVVVAVPLVVGGSSNGSHGPVQVSPAQSSPPSAGTTGSAPDFLTPVALSMVRRNGEPLPTQIQAVAVDDGAVADAQLLGAAADDTSHVAAWVIEARGSFSCIDCDRAGETGSVLVGVYNPDSNDFDGHAVSDHWVDLHALGAAYALPTRDAATGKVVTLAEAKAIALLESTNPSEATVAWTRALTAGELAAASSNPRAHLGLAPSTPMIVVAVNGPLGSDSRFAVMVTTDGTGPGTSSMECLGDFCGLAPPAG